MTKRATVDPADALARARAGELLTAADVAAIWHLSRDGFSWQNKRGAFDQFKVRPAIGRRIYSGVLVVRYLNGEPLYEPSFGRKRA